MYLCIKESSDKVFIYVPFVTDLFITTSNITLQSFKFQTVIKSWG